MSTLAKETGLPKSAFYHHFESKAGLLSAVMEQGAYGFFDAMREAHRNPPEGGPPLCFSRSCNGTAGLPARHDCVPLSKT
ncbi:TetR/AcrR family transcriptional regulator [Streptomyces sp. NBC_01589]|uniref:TetR/AcrR family transcriptional regulator n=1 Tax=unclassified Streptomyces TaxID=2593676 RepID=UPI003867E4F4